MKNFLSVYKSILIVAMLCFVLGCNKSVNQKVDVAQGGQDSGGGDTLVSSIENVEYTYNKIKPHLSVMLAEFFSSKNILYFKSKEKQKLLIYAAFLISQAATTSDLKQDIEAIINMSKVEIKRDQPCKSLDKEHAAGSIKEFKLGSPICISFLELKKIPKHGLEKEIIGLFLHELMHALGLDESQAIEIQEALILNFDRIFLNGSFMYIVTSEDRSYFGYDSLKDSLKELKDDYLNIKIGTKIIKEEHTKFCEPVFIVLLIEWIRVENYRIIVRLIPELIDAKDATLEDLQGHLDEIDRIATEYSERSERQADACSSLGNDKRIDIKIKNLLGDLGKTLEKFIGQIEKSELLVKRYN